jgi:hypothetical protein
MWKFGSTLILYHSVQNLLSSVHKLNIYKSIILSVIYVAGTYLVSHLKRRTQFENV